MHESKHDGFMPRLAPRLQHGTTAGSCRLIIHKPLSFDVAFVTGQWCVSGKRICLFPEIMVLLDVFD